MRAEYKVVGQYAIEEADEDGYLTGRDAQPGETVWLDDDEHTIEINGQKVKRQINVRALLMAGLIAPVDKPAKPEGAAKVTAPKAEKD